MRRGLLIVAGVLLAPALMLGAQMLPSGDLLTAATTTTFGAAQRPVGSQITVQALGTTGSGTGAATVQVEVSDVEQPDPTTVNDWIVAGTITLTLGTTQTSDGFAIAAPWRNVRAHVTAISGTGATVTVRIGGAR